MELKSYLRRSYVAIALLTILALAVCFAIGVDMPEWVAPLILKVVAVFVASGILVQTGETAQKLSFSIILQKFASPVTLSALYALFGFMKDINFAFVSSEWYIFLGKVALIAYGLINDPNNKNALVDNVAAFSTNNN